MVIVKIILIYFVLISGLRFIIDLGLFFLIKITYLLSKPIDKMLKRYINWLINPKITYEAEDLYDRKALSVKNVIKLLFIGIKYSIKENYRMPSKFKNSMLLKFKYIIKEFIDNLHNKMYELPLCNQVLTKKEKFLYYIRLGFNLCIFNFAMIVLLYWKFIDGNKVMVIAEYIKNIKYEKYLNFLIIIISMPVIKTLWNYNKIKLLFKNECNELESKYVCLYKIIDKNIEELNIYIIDQEIKCIANEITNNIGFEFYIGKLKMKNKISIYDKEENRLQIEGITDKINEINKFIEDNFIKKNKDRCIFEQWFLSESYIFQCNEKKILDYKLNRDYEELSRYFRKNRNQIYKRKFTNVRVIKQEQIDCLDYQINKCEKWLEDYRSEFIEYFLDILIFKYKARKQLIYMDRSLFSTNFIDILRTIVRMSIREYLLIIKRIIY